MKYVSKSFKKVDGMDIAMGKPVYTDDLQTGKNSLVIKLKRSPHAYARIVNIDTKNASKVPGVIGVYTYKDTPDVRFTLAGQSYPELSPYDRLILDEYVRYVGDEVAIVAARTEEAAVKAINLIKVEYDILKPVLDFEKAIGNSSIVHAEEDIEVMIDTGLDTSNNTVSVYNMGYGDVEDELSKCDAVVEGTYYTQGQAHAMMETYRAYSYLDEYGRLTIVTSTQVPFHVRRIVSRALGLPKSKIRVIKPRIGGGFGGKQTIQVELFTAFVTLKTGMPSKIIYDRHETFSASNSRHPMKIKVRMGADRDGKLRALDIEGLADTGAYGEHAPTVFTLVGGKTLPLYNKTKACKYHAKAVYTNKMSTGALRGYGATQGTFAVESTLDKLAHKLNIDPTEIRLKNIINEGEYSQLLDGSTENNPVQLNSSTLNECIVRGKKNIGWDNKYPSVRISDTKVRGVGMAVTMQGSGIAGIDVASAVLKLNNEGFFTLLLGSADMGTGSDTTMMQIASEVLDVPMDTFTVHSADTDISPYDTGSYASSTAYVTGNAVIKAANNMKKEIIRYGAKILDISEEEADFIDGKVINEDGSKEITLVEVAHELVMGKNRQQLICEGTFAGKTSPPPFLAGFAEVEVDTETGKVELIQYVAEVDCGTAINPNIATVQTEGGIVQGIGMALYEDVQYTNQGKMMTDTFMQYKIPNRKDIGKVKVEIVSSHEPTGPFGAKSIGEVVINTPLPAIANAIYNAVGVRINSLPITPEKVLLALLEKDND